MAQMKLVRRAPAKIRAFTRLRNHIKLLECIERGIQKAHRAAASSGSRVDRQLEEYELVLRKAKAKVARIAKRYGFTVTRSKRGRYHVDPWLRATAKLYQPKPRKRR